MAFDRHACCVEQAKLFSIQVSVKYPVTVTDGLEVFLLHPSFALVGMSSLGPTPDGLEDRMVDSAEGLFADDMSMVLRPTSDNGVEFGNQLTGGQMLMVLDEGADFEQESFDALFGRFNQQFAVVLR